jgi:hypothetical protein
MLNTATLFSLPAATFLPWASIIPLARLPR